MIKSARKKFLGGFTLIELLIVIAILGILAAAVLVAINPAKRTRQARDAQRKNDIGSLATEVQAYYTAPGQGLYPSTLTVLTTEGYMKQLPDPPGTATTYTYLINATTSEASLYDFLEDPTSGTGLDTRFWCWRSAAGTAVEALTDACAP